MAQSPGCTWEEIRRELADRAYGVLLIDAMAVGVGGMASRYLGREMWAIGLAVSAYVTVGFAVLILGDLALQCVLGWWSGRAGR